MNTILELNCEKQYASKQLKSEIDQFILQQHLDSNPKTCWKTPFKVLYIYTLFPYMEPEKYKLFKYTERVIRNNYNSKINEPCLAL